MNKEILFDAELDTVGTFCPMPISLTKEEIGKLKIGQILKIEADDPAAESDIKAWAKHAGHMILSFEKEGTILTFFVKKMK